MGKKSEPVETPRKGVNTRITDDLRLRLERSAAHSNRTVGSDIEHRLEASFKLDFVNERGLGALLQNDAALDFLSNVGAVLDQVLGVSRDRNFSEIETRKAMRAAMAVLVSNHLWMGEETPSDPIDQGDRIKPSELPPGRLGRRLAVDHMIWDATWHDRAVVDDTLDGRVSNRWTGDGSAIELGEPPKPKQPPRNLIDLSLEEIEADPRFEKPENLHRYKSIG
ncbi:hypothetical protein MKK84_24265 [Methylobacterium sp. E-065]|uniref:hypothetical protein n=1 Tax=Methylobacterium sp. E-065 TaxID=2836583 RepID=UPI001FBA0809|nr:hypothetical protein [Methylobacterium sp. E-065]MCJ2020506.1 hypothetical protein [Methylobacterium sp. E-065]